MMAGGWQYVRFGSNPAVKSRSGPRAYAIFDAQPRPKADVGSARFRPCDPTLNPYFIYLKSLL